MAATASTESAEPAGPAPPAVIALWPAEVLARHLVSQEPLIRTVALGMAVQDGAPIDRCVDELVKAAQHSAGDPLASQLAATALGCLPPARANDAVQGCLAGFCSAENPVPVRIAAAHALFRLGCMPAAAHEPVGAMLLDADPNARKVALLAASPFARAAAGAIARCVAATPPADWTVEALHALVKSAGDNGDSRSKVEAFIMRSLAGAPLVPTGIAAYVALASLNPAGAAMRALVQVAGDTGNPDASAAALEALGGLGETAQPAAATIGQLLAATEDPPREELLARTLVRLRAPARDVPIARVVLRVQEAPDRSAAAHCMLLCLHPKDFAQAAVIVRKRFEVAGEALRKALAQTYKSLTGAELTGDPIAGRN